MVLGSRIFVAGNELRLSSSAPQCLLLAGLRLRVLNCADAPGVECDCLDPTQTGLTAFPEAAVRPGRVSLRFVATKRPFVNQRLRPSRAVHGKTLSGRFRLTTACWHWHTRWLVHSVCRRSTLTWAHDGGQPTRDTHHLDGPD